MSQGRRKKSVLHYSDNIRGDKLEIFLSVLGLECMAPACFSMEKERKIYLLLESLSFLPYTTKNLEVPKDFV